jgi:2-iminobutanoate/2-iminopropanoate deaminase
MKKVVNSMVETQSFNMPWEKEYGYAQAVKKGNTVWLAGQLGHDEKGVLADGMEEQLKQTYRNAQKLLEGFDMSLDNVVEEVLYVLDMKTAFEARKTFGKHFYQNSKKVASTIVVVGGLALPDQLIEIKFVAIE